MYLEHLIPAKFAAFADPASFVRRLLHPDLVSFGLLANLRRLQARGLLRGIDGVVDAGANAGQFAYMMSRVRRDLPIVSFEPHPGSYAKLEATFRRFSIRGRCLPLALGARDAEDVLHEYAESVNNSLLPRTDAPAGRTLPIEVRRLDALGAETVPFERMLLKIDVQGAELDVLEGASGVLDRVRLALVEVSFVRAYSGGASAPDVIAQFAARGFRLLDLVDTLRLSDAEGRGLREADLLFVNDRAR
jgi:FkbM family methyltransferase